MKNELYDDIIQALKDRTEWEGRQSVWYRMRHGGLRRGNKPYPNAPDLHFPLVDSNIEKLKPFYFQQLYAAETFAAFIALKPQSNELTTSAAGWFDYKLKQQTNLEREILCAIDHMENNGSSLVKIYWDEDSKRLCYDARDPLYVIVPKMTNDIQDSDWLVDVIHMSEAQYRANPNFNQDDGFIKLIKGKDTTVSGAIAKGEDASRREGITMGADDGQIVLWEIYKKGDKAITVQTISPLQPLEDKQVRDDFDLPYNLGPFKGGKRIPFARFRMEIKDKGWYSPRGISEILAPFETSMCRMWNAKHEAMDFFNRPTYQSDRDLGNVSNIKMLPGQILPPGITPTQNPTPPISFDEEMQNTRASAEYRLQIPDLGASRHLTPGGEGAKGNVTATQINAIVGQSSQSDDMRARIFRLDLAELYQMSWAIYLQYDRKSLDYVLADELTQVSDEALHDQYLIAPNGSADGWNKSLQIQKSVARKQMLGQSPYIDQGELDKTILEVDDPKLVKRLWRDPGTASKNQMERQAEEISIMLLGFPAEVEPSDDDVAHLQSWSGFIDRRMHAQEPITPEFAKLMIQHEQSHEQQMGQKRGKRLPQIKQAAMPYLQLLSQIAQSEQQPQNVIQGPGGPPPPQQEPIDPIKQAELQLKQQKQGADIQRDQAKIQLDTRKVAISLQNSLASLQKAGVPITEEQINKALADAGLPPITQPIQPTQQIV